MTLELERERTVQALCAHFAQDHLTTQELEVRLEEVYRAPTSEALQSMLRGLPALPVTAAATASIPFYSVAPVPEVQEKRYLSLMAEVRRQGVWNVPSRVRARALMGALRLDLREALLPATGVDIDVSALMGEVRIILPPGVRAEVDGLAIMGEFSDRTASAASTLDAPAIRIRGRAVMGAVRVETRLPNESAMAAWKRRLLNG